MKKKIAYMLIGAMCAIIMSYGFVAYADQNSSTTTEDNKTTTASDTYVVPTKAEAAALAAATTTTTTASVQPKATANAAPITLDKVKKLEMKIAGTNISIKIELKHEDAKTESTVEINRGKKQEKQLTGTEAAQFIQQLLAALNLQANMNKQQVADVLFNHFEVEPAKVELKLEIKTVNQPTEIKVVHEKDDEDGDKDEDKDKDKDRDDDGDKAKLASLPVVKSTSDVAQKQAAKTAQLTKQAEKKALIAKKKALQEAWKKAHKEQQATKKQQQKLERGDRDGDHHDGNNQGDEDDDHDDDHGDHEGHGHEGHDDRD
ncbi:YusW-like protein [Paenibacillus taihuensis]|uniref:YusW-like protein n=1 Tax=Paenibacillus taihuensis TaxID=1156355 RepID=A0A3D9QW81_9BACL|nr:YusW family protein [Paenibacillus taihuensis]REE69621.1 YusW-like protein [Paenibacillus taihuensis]